MTFRSLLLFGMALGFTLNTAHAWTIERYHMEANIQGDGAVEITETIEADFSDNLRKHGIIRDMPFKYAESDTKNYQTPIEAIRVTDGSGQPRNFTKTINGSDVSLKIGRADTFVQAQETYVISYRVTGVLTAFDEHDEFYWNVTGNDWDAPILQASALVTLPEAAALKTECFTGFADSTEQKCEHKISSIGNSAAYMTSAPLSTGQGLTVVLGWPKGLVTIPEREYLMNWDYWWSLLKLWLQKFEYLAIALTLLAPLTVLFKSWKTRQSTKVHKPVIPLYHPPQGFSVGELGVLDHQQFNAQDLSAIIIQLILAGYLKIEAKDATYFWDSDDFLLTAQKPPYKPIDAQARFVWEHLQLNNFEPQSLNNISQQSDSIFHFKTFSRLAGNVSQAMAPLLFKTASATIYRTPQQRFSSPKSKSAVPLFLLSILSFFGAALSTNINNNPTGIVAFLAILGGAALLVPRYTKLGNEKRNELAGYKLFLKTADQQRINWSEAQQIFEENLPYAISLGLTDKWYEVFKDKIKFPEGIVDEKGLNAVEKHLTKQTQKRVRATAPKPKRTHSSTGGSGFSGGRSGGGHGGGGGRSW